MGQRKTVLHFIETLSRGGAETMLVAVSKRLTEYNNIIVTLKNENVFGDEVVCDKIFSLELRSMADIPRSVVRLKKIIKENNVDIVHSHLFWATVVARFATPGNIPLVSTIHTFPADSIDYRPLRMRIIEMLTFRYRKNAIIGVAKGSLQQYKDLVKTNPYKSYVLYTFVDTEKFNTKNISAKSGESDIFRLVSMGNFKEQKNHEFLLEAFKKLKSEKISLDLYGAGNLQGHLQKIIDDNQLNVSIKGQISNVSEVLPQYDLFVMSSRYEGFALAVLEAMAMKIPLLLSDIASFREQCEDTAVYFSLKDTSDFIEKLIQLKEGKQRLIENAVAANERVCKMFTLDIHVERLKNIYLDLLEDGYNTI